MKSRLFAIDVEFMVERFAVDRKHELKRKEMDARHKKATRNLNIRIAIIVVLWVSVVVLTVFYFNRK